MAKRIVVIGSNFAGLTAAVELKQKLGDEHEVVVVSRSRDFLFNPSLIWVPFGLRKKEDVTFPVAPVFEKKGIRFVEAPVTGIELDARRVITPKGVEPYDYLVIATGPKLDFESVPGLGPKGYTQSIMNWEDADQARVAFEAFLKRPGPVVIGAVQKASCFGAAYEFLFNMAYQLKKRGLQKEAPLTFVTAEPFLSHFGLGGFGSAEKMVKAFFAKLGIDAITSASVDAVEPGEIQLAGGRRVPFSYAMLVPSFLGVEAVRACKAITTPAGFVKVNARYQTEAYPEVFAAGVAVAMDPPGPTAVPCGVPKTGYLSEEMARVVAHNIVAAIRDEAMVELPPGSIDAKCVLDAGNMGIIMLADHFLEPRDRAWLIPGPEAHWAKLAFEKYFLATHRRGHV